jgi:Protein of unknown function (DUF642)/PEP-CTERM motif
MRKILLALTAVAASTLAPAAAGAVTIANPSFESFNAGLNPNPGSGSGFITLTGAQLPGWTIGASIDHIGNYWTAQDGALSIDLDGLAAGTISQTLTGLSAGTEYIVSFFISANNDGPASSNTKTAQLTLGNTMNMVSYTRTGLNTNSNMLWQQVSYSFVADSDTALLRLASTNAPGSAFGLAVDNFSISATPEPAAWAMMIFGFGIAGVSIRRGKQMPKLRTA